MTEQAAPERLADKVWLSPEEAAEYSKIGRTRIYKFLADGELPSAKLGKTRHIKREHLDEFLEEHINR